MPSRQAKMATLTVVIFLCIKFWRPNLVAGNTSVFWTTGHVDNLCITFSHCVVLRQLAELPRHRKKKSSGRLPNSFSSLCAAQGGQSRPVRLKLTCHRFSLHDDGAEDDASYDRLYGDPLDAFFYGVNRAQEPPQYILQNLKIHHS